MNRRTPINPEDFIVALHIDGSAEVIHRAVRYDAALFARHPLPAGYQLFGVWGPYGDRYNLAAVPTRIDLDDRIWARLATDAARLAIEKYVADADHDDRRETLSSHYIRRGSGAL